MMRTIMLLLATAMLTLGCGEETTTVIPTTEQEPAQLIDGEFSAVITVINDGMSAWLITSIEGSNASASINSQNVTIRLNKGLRYKFINLGGPNHPLDFRDSNGDYLLTQDTISGRYEEHDEINFIFNYGEGSVAFTITDELAAELASYNCTIHEAMTGDLSVN